MLLAYFVYLSILAVVLSFGWITVQTKPTTYTVWRGDILIPTLFVSLLMGMRYAVGTDWENYRIFYESIKRAYDVSTSGLEPLYTCLNQWIAWCEAPYETLFFVVMLLHLILFYQSFDRHVFLLPLGVYFYFTTLFFSSLNIQRQTLSFCIFLFSVRYLIDRRLFPYMLCALAATLVHYSSVILFPVYLLGYAFFNFLNKKWVQLGLYVFSFFVGTYLFQLILDVLSEHITNAKYINTLKLLGSMEMEVNTGLGLIASAGIDICLILSASKLSKVYRVYHYDILFRIFFIGVLLSNALGLDLFLSRVPFVLESLRFLLLAFWVYYLLEIRRTLWNCCCGVIVIGIYFCMFIAAISHGHAGCSPFQFA